MDIYDKNITTQENVNMMFPDWNRLKKGEWSSYPKRFYYPWYTVDGIQCKNSVEINLYRESEPEMNGTYSLIIFDEDDVIFSEPLLLPIGDDDNE